MIFDDNSKIIFVKSSLKPILWVLIRIESPRRGDSNAHPQHRFYHKNLYCGCSEAILMSTHNIGFYEEISKIIT